MTNGFAIALTPVAAFLVACAMMPVTRQLALRLDVVARPSAGRPHSKPTPMLGGLAILGGFVFAIGLVGVLSGLPYHMMPWLMGFVVAMFLVGLFDDVVDLPPRRKLSLQFLAICLVGAWGPQFDLLPYQSANMALTILWLLSATNAFNLIDGLDGLAAGVGIAASLSVAAVAGLHLHFGTMVAGLALSGALAGFLVFNFPPASIFMGDSGALAVGLILGVLSIQASHAGEGSLPARLAMPLLALMVPLLDTVTVTVTRLATGNPISKRGLDHSHHRLARLGLSSATSAATLVALQLIAAVCAIGLSVVPGYEAVLLLPYMALFFALVALFLMDRSFDSEVPGHTAHLPAVARVILSFGYKRRFVEIVLDVALVAGAYFGATILRFDFSARPDQVEAMLIGLPWIVLFGCGSFITTGVYRGIWRYTGMAEGVRFALAAIMAGAAVYLASMVLPIAISRATTVVFVMLLFNFLVATRWSFHVFRRIGRLLARSTQRVVIIGADARGQAAVQHLQSTVGIGADLLGLIDEDGFKHGKLFQGYPVLGSISDLEEIMKRTPFNEIVIAQEAMSAEQLGAIQRFARNRELSLRRFWLGVTDLMQPGPAARERPAEFDAAANIGSLVEIGSPIMIGKLPGSLGS